MSILGSAFGRALSGAGTAAAGMASKFIDEEIATNRARTLAEIQRQYRGLERTDQAAFDDARAPTLREQKRLDMLDAGATAREVELAGLQDEPLIGARRAAADTAAKDTTHRAIESRKTELTELTPAEVAAANAKLEGTMGAEVKRAGLLSEAQARAQAKYREPRADTPQAIAAKVAAIEKITGPLSPDEKKVLFGIAAKPRDPELDTETVTEEKLNPDGTTTKVQRKQVRRPGGASAAPEASDPSAKLRAAVEKARSDGKIGEAISELRKRGATPAQILQAGITQDELQAASQPTRRTEAAPKAPMDLIQTMSTSDLKRIAAIDGHVSQQKAKEELERRRQSGRQDELPYDAAGMINAAP